MLKSFLFAISSMISSFLFLLGFVFLSIYLSSLSFFYNNSSHENSNQKENLHTIQTIVETFAVDHKGIYPKNFQVLEKEAKKMKYWTELRNPYNKKNILFINKTFT